MSKMIERTKIILISSGKLLILAVLLVGLMLWLSGSFHEKVPPGEPLARAKTTVLKTVVAQEQTYPLIMEQPGTVQTREQSQIAARIMAQVKEVLVREGDQVQGPENGSPTVLARLDDREIRAKLLQAQAQAQQAAAELRRMEKLIQGNAATGQQLEQAQTQARIAQAAVQETETMLSYTTITAPISGIVVQKSIYAGNMVAPGQILFQLQSPKEPELHALVAESLTQYLKKGQDIGMQLQGRQIRGKLSEIIPQADPQTRTVLVKVAIAIQSEKSRELVSGLYGVLEVPVGQYQAIVVPRQTIREVGQLPLVDILENGSTQRRFITMGNPHGDLVEVLSGLKAGAEVVVHE